MNADTYPPKLAPQSLPVPVSAEDARWSVRLSKTQRAVLRILYAGSQTSQELSEQIPGQPPEPAIDCALTRLMQLGFVDAGLALHRGLTGLSYYLNTDGRKRAEQTRPKLTRP